jgi:hypothetical protein
MDVPHHAARPVGAILPAMVSEDPRVAVYGDHDDAETAVADLIHSGTDPRRISIVGLGYHLAVVPTGLELSTEPIRFWGKTGEFWGGIWAVGSGSFYFPGLGPVVLGGAIASRVEDALSSSGPAPAESPVVRALLDLGIAADEARTLEDEIRADRCLVVVSGPEEEVAR